MEEEKNMETTMIDDTVIVKFKIGNYNKNIIDLLRMMEISNKSKATEEDIEELSKEVKTKWWKENKIRLLDENNS